MIAVVGRRAPRWSAEQWQEATVVLLRRCRERCEWCGNPLVAGQVERHHRQRRRVGGDRYENLLMLHPACHKNVHAHPAIARTMGAIVSSYEEDPAETPLVDYRGTVWRLTPEGTREMA